MLLPRGTKWDSVFCRDGYLSSVCEGATPGTFTGSTLGENGSREEVGLSGTSSCRFWCIVCGESDTLSCVEGLDGIGTSSFYVFISSIADGLENSWF